MDFDKPEGFLRVSSVLFPCRVEVVVLSRVFQRIVFLGSSIQYQVLTTSPYSNNALYYTDQFYTIQCTSPHTEEGHGGRRMEKRLLDYLDDTITNIVPQDPTPDVSTGWDDKDPCKLRSVDVNLESVR